MKPRLTPWFPASVAPERLGEYEFKYVTGYCFRAFWNGFEWLVRDAQDLWYWDKPVVMDGEWRGLAEDPAKAKP